MEQIDKFLAWLNVRLWILEGEAEKLTDGKKKHEVYVRINELKDVKNSYHRLRGNEVQP